MVYSYMLVFAETYNLNTDFKRYMFKLSIFFINQINVLFLMIFLYSLNWGKYLELVHDGKDNVSTCGYNFVC